MIRIYLVFLFVLVFTKVSAENQDKFNDSIAIKALADKYSYIYGVRPGVIIANEEGKFEIDEILPDQSYDSLMASYNNEKWIKKEIIPDTTYKYVGGKYGLINYKDEIIAPFVYDLMYCINDGIIIVKKDGKFGVINCLGGELIKPQYDSISKFYMNQVVYQLKNKW